MAIAGFLPGVEIETRFQRATSSDTPILSAYVFGPAARLIRYGESTEKALGLLGTYDEDATVDDTSWTYYQYPQRQAGDIIDKSYSKLFVDNGYLQYWNIAAGTLTAPSRNEIRHPGGIFLTGNGYTQSSFVGDRGVKVGDPIKITGVRTTSDAFTLNTYVAGLVADMTASAVASATAAATNVATVSGTSSVTPGGSNSGNVTVTVPGSSAYNGLASGYVTETYRIEVITGGIASAARLKVTSASGTDNQASITPAAFGTAFNIGTRGAKISVALESPATTYALGDVFTVSYTQAHTAPTVTTAGTYAPTDGLNRTYVVTVTKGAKYDESPIIRVSEVNGLDAVQTYTLVSTGTPSNTVAVALGNYGATIAFNASTGLFVNSIWTVACTAAAPAQIRRIKLAHSLPADINFSNTNANLDVTLYIKGNYEIPKKSTVSGQYHYESRDLDFRVASGIQLIDPSWTISGVPTALPLKSPSGFSDVSKLYLQTRQWVARQSAIGSFTLASELATLIPGPTHPDNPLKYALSKAALGSGGRRVYYFIVGDPLLLANWSKALAEAEKERGAYGLVPLTTDDSVYDLVAAFATNSSDPLVNMDKVCWFTAPELKETVIVNAALSSDGNNVLATIADNANAAGTQYTLVTATSGNSLFSTKGVKAGDILRVNYASDAWGDVSYSSYVVDSVINESSLLLVAGPAAAVNVATKIEIWRTVDTTDFISIIKGKLAPFTRGADQALTSTSAVKYFGFLNRYLPFGIVYDGLIQVPAYHMCALLAAIRSDLAPHQGMTRYPITGFSDVKDIRKFSGNQLNQLAEAGCFIVQPDDRTGVLRVRHAITAGDYSDINTREESCISNVHSIKFTMFDVLDPYIGQANVTDETLAMIESDIRSVGQQLQSANAGRQLGGQIRQMRIIQIRQSPLFKDTILIDVEITIPAPINKIRLTLYVQ